MGYADGDSLQVRIQIAFGATITDDPSTWTWTDVTDYWHVPDEVQISWGRSEGAEQPEPSRLSLTLKNHDGRFSAYNPLSPYWPNVRPWTPIQFDIDLGDGQGWRNRFSGYVRRWPVSWPGRSSRMALARIEAVGILGRLGRGKPPAKSAMRRYIESTGPVAYWPLEDGVAADRAASALPGHPPVTVDGSVEFRSVDDYDFPVAGTSRFGTTALPDLSGGGRLTADLPAEATAATAQAWTVTTLAWVTPDTSAGVNLLSVECPGGSPYVRYDIVLSYLDSTEYLIGYDAADNGTILSQRGGITGSLTDWWIHARQVGGNIILEWRIADLTAATVPGTLAGVTRVVLNRGQNVTQSPLPYGHLAVWAGDAGSLIGLNGPDEYGAIVGQALLSYHNEAAHLRLARLCAEDGIPIEVGAVTDARDVTRMGWQSAGTLLDLLRQCETADQGLLYEQGFGLGYLPRVARYNPPVALTIDAALGQLGGDISPVDDDQRLRNRWTVERIEGSSAVAEDRESIDAHGEIEASVQVNLASDAALPGHAAWRLHQSTVREPRYPSLSLDLAASPELAAAWCDCRPGSRVQAIHLPPQHPGEIDQLITGATEVFRGRRSWRVTLNVTPARPWLVGVYDVSRYDTAGSQLAVAAGPDDTTVDVSTTAGPAWTTDPAMLPLDLNVGGERVTVTAITPAVAGAQRMTVVRAINGMRKSHPAGTPVRLWQPAVYAL